MSKVIRVTSNVFTRLQELAEPLVDTPASVIERLLDHYDDCVGRAPAVDAGVLEAPPLDTAAASYSVRAAPALAYEVAGSGQGLFLAPASDENVGATIEKDVELSYAAEHLEPDQLNRLTEALGGRTGFRCWAMTEAKRSTFRAMKPGDVALLSVSGTGLFGYAGRILTTLESEALGNALWPVQADDPWKLIYVFDDVEPLHVSKRRAVQVLGYSPNFVVPGVIRVDPRLVSPLESRFGSLEGFLRAIRRDGATTSKAVEDWPGGKRR